MLLPLSLLEPMDHFNTQPLLRLSPFKSQDFRPFAAPKRSGSAPPTTEAKRLKKRKVKTVPSDQLFVFKNAFTPTPRKNKSPKYVSPKPLLKVSPPISMLAMSDEDIFDFQMPNVDPFHFNTNNQTQYNRSASTGPQTHYDHLSSTQQSFENQYFNDYEGDFKSPFHPLDNAPECNYRNIENIGPECNYAPMHLFNGDMDQMDPNSMGLQTDSAYNGNSMDGGGYTTNSMMLEQAFNQQF
jgi:hypothetical protein